MPPICAPDTVDAATPATVFENPLSCAIARASDEGTVGLLRIGADGNSYEGEIRVIRCRALEGAADRHHLGTEFLRTYRVPHGSPLRSAFFAMMKTSFA